MKILVVGGGGREHALAWKLSQSPHVETIYCVPGNGGIEEIATCINMDVGDFDGLIRFSKQESIDLVVVGPEGPLAAGIVDAFQSKGIAIFGPQKNGALVETSKVFAKRMMEKYDVPTAPFQVFSDYGEAASYAEQLTPPYVVKADGLCAGKGAYVIHDRAEGLKALNDLLVEKIFGQAGNSVIIESFLKGVEVSYLGLSDGETVLPLLPAQDHKPLLDNDQGPNTGGMGAYTPVPFMNPQIEMEIDRVVMKRSVRALAEGAVTFKGVLYGGLMLSDDNKPWVLEFNARFGDPETQPILYKMESDLLPYLMACVEGGLSRMEPISWKPGVSVCVVLAAKGYPEKPVKGDRIFGLEDLKGRADVKVFHAGTRKDGDRFYTAGGRVLGVTALGDSYSDAIRKVYDAVGCIKFEGMQYRTDIGRKSLGA
ncbi:MAG TPA: phosphoribosylamine--glycine ligase [Deltaproteobacteria bacterium]|nr:phosphoribosylamine--glycine ligase [Deltaproteobacteria bacterium]